MPLNLHRVYVKTRNDRIHKIKLNRDMFPDVGGGKLESMMETSVYTLSSDDNCLIIPEIVVHNIKYIIIEDPARNSFTRRIHEFRYYHQTYPKMYVSTYDLCPYCLRKWGEDECNDGDHDAAYIDEVAKKCTFHKREFIPSSLSVDNYYKILYK